jgi:dolichyl-diphosphooligosaccharide--protein glycosyltransferase/undecaprenyl-diphosphooligosaccharide--protein glycosyltransferase
LDKEVSNTKLTIIFIVVAFIFSIALRMIWVYQFADVEAFKFNGQLMINTNDGYYWAEGARDIINGVSQKNDSSPITSAPSILTAYFASILPFSFETIILYMPAWLGSLIVIPIILIGKRLKNLEMGFIAALLASIAWSYYNRTMVGYYDTDMLNIVLPMFLLWSIIWAVDTKDDKFLIITAIDILLYRLWYPQSYSLELSFFSLVLLYTLIFDRKNLYNYKLLAMIMFAMLMVDMTLRLILIFGAFYIFKQKNLQKYVYHIFVVSIVIFFATGGVNPVWAQLKGYIFKDAVSATKTGLNLHFFSVVQTIREAGQIPFETFANRISGHIITFILSVLGFLYLSYRHKIILFALPMVGLGFLALSGGLRFTVYAVPILALGIAFLITEISSKMPNKTLKYFIMSVLTAAVLYPNILHIESYKVPTVCNADEVAVLDTLKEIADREDYVIAWWDYGYPIRYYADVKTLADGGKHSGNLNFPISYILTNPQKPSANMARLNVEYTESKRVKTATKIEQMIKDYGLKDVNEFLRALNMNMQMPPKTRDIYIYLPVRMLEIYPTITLFSNINLMNGNKLPSPFFFRSINFKETKTSIELGQGVSINKTNATIKIGEQSVPINRFVKTAFDNKMQTQKTLQVSNPKANINVIYMSSYKTFLLLDNKTYNSLYIQLFVLDEFDKKLFDKVIMNPHAKIFKLKI